MPAGKVHHLSQGEQRIAPLVAVGREEIPIEILLQKRFGLVQISRFVVG